MAEPNPPGLIFGDIPQADSGGNEAMPRFGGRESPGDTIHFEVDGEPRSVQTDENGFWDFSSPELGNGEHEFEMWTENAAGERSESVEWEANINATENDRRFQRERNEQWDESGRDAWHQQNAPAGAAGGGGSGSGSGRPLVPPTAIPNPGGGSGQPGGAGGTSVAGLEKGNQAGVRVLD